MDVDLLKMPCAVVSVDAQDAMGTHKVDIEGDLKSKFSTNKGAYSGVLVILRSERDAQKRSHVWPNS